MSWIRFLLELVVVAVLSVSLLPLVPSWLAPALLPLIMVHAVADDNLPAMNSWAIWGGLVFDLLNPARFGLIWLPTLFVALLLREARRLTPMQDLPWLWPLWFAAATACVSLPLAVITGRWPTWALVIAATTGWGTLTLLFRRWVAASRAVRARS